MRSRSKKAAKVIGWALALVLAAAACGPETGGQGGGGAGGTGAAGSGGAPQLCAKATDCPEPPSECVERFCDAGKCGSAALPNGADAPTQSAGDCKKNLCAGGEVITVEDSSDVPEDDGSPCTIEACVLSAAAVTNAAAGTACALGGGAGGAGGAGGGAAGLCDGEGQCVECLADPDCGTAGICVANACVPATCMDGVMNGDETDVDCGGSCRATCAGGEACLAGEDCATGHCADGVCCDTACDGACVACTAAKKGSGADGTCGNVPDGQDPDDECASDVECGSPEGTCDGKGGCKAAAAGTACGDGTGATVCDGKGACKAALGQPCAAAGECLSGQCADGVCCDTACGGLCQACLNTETGLSDGACGPVAAGTDPEDECAGVQVCGAGGACVGLPNGAACAAGADCQSGSCTDGVCCNAACGGLCQACSAARKGTGTDGVCGNILNGTDPDDECGGATVCNGAGACALLPAGAQCTQPSECQSVACVDGYCCNTACTDACQACSAAKKGTGGNGVCGAIASGLDPDGECAGDLVCNGSGLCKAPSGSPCAAASECLSGQCADGVCCNTACTAICQACTAAKKGGGADGTCGNIGAGLDPDSECTGAASCGGSGACVLLPLGTACTLNAECQSGQCADGVCCNSACNTTCQACTAAKKGGGADGLCASVAVGTDPDGECPGATACNGNACALFPNGSPCTINQECQSTQCVDGVCCNNACSGLCKACTAAKKGGGADGTCDNIVSGLDPDDECAGSLVCSGAGTCQ